MPRPLKNFLEFLPIKTIDLVLSALPRSWAIRMGELLGWILSFILSRREKLMMANLALAFPKKSKAELRRIVTGVWKNIGRVAGEFLRLSDINRSNFRSYFEIVGEKVIEAAKAKGKGIIFVGFHYANWEMSGVGGNFVHGHMVAVARPIKNPWVEKWIRRKRGEGGMDIILHRDAVRGCLRALKAKNAVGILVDQNLYQGGVFVNFFGRPAATTPLPALLHTRTDAPILLLYCERHGKKLRLVAEEPPPFPKDVQAITQVLSTRIEEIIRAHPENWFWVHNRWKRQPFDSQTALAQGKPA